MRLPTRKVEVLLAYLALHPSAHTREKLAAMLWGDSPDERARGSLRKALTLLRAGLGEDVLVADRETVQLNPEVDLWVDALEFQAQASELLAAGSGDAGAIDLDLYAGDLLPDSYDDWIMPLRMQFRDLFVRSVLHLIDLAAAHGAHEQAIDLAARLLRHDPANEEGHRRLMLAYAATDRYEAALDQYARCQRSLRAELDVDPSPATDAVYERIRRQRTLPPAHDRLNNLPAPLTTFVGRESLLSEIRATLAGRRLVTLTGPGGSGKTRLAVQVAGEELGAFADGICWADLTALKDGGLVPQALARALGLYEAPGMAMQELLAGYLRPRQLLLVLDNCEHLVMACAQLAGSLLAACPRLTVLATSREPLGIAGEAVMQVPPMALPPAEAQTSPALLIETESVRLFSERVRAVSPHFALSAENAPAVSAICRRLDGLPLAIELAAARVKMVSPAQIAERLADRFTLLTGGSRLAPARQQTLRAAIDWSYLLLDEPERALLRRLSVFEGGFALEAAEALWQDAGRPPTLDLLSRLVDKSLVNVESESPEARGMPRYRLLESICEYAAEQLVKANEAEDTRRRHLAIFCELAEQSEGALYGPRQALVANALEVELDNFRAALTFGLEHEPVLALRTAAALGYFWARRAGPSEGRHWLELAIERVETLPAALHNPACQAAYARAWGWLGQTAMAGGDNLLASRCFARAADLAEATGDMRTRAMAIGLSGLLELMAGNVEAAGRHLQEGIDLLRAQNDRVTLPMALGTMGRYWMITGRDDEARACAEEAIDLAVETGNRWFAAWSYMTLGWSDKGRGAFDRAKQNLDEGLAIFSEMGDKHFANVARSSVADMARLSGDRDTARKLYRQIMLAWRDLGNLGAVARCLECLAFLEVSPADLSSQRAVAPCDDKSAATRPSDAARLLGAAAALRRRHAAPMAAYEEEEHRRHVAALRACAGSEAFAEAWASGEALAPDEAFALALQGF